MPRRNTDAREIRLIANKLEEFGELNPHFDSLDDAVTALFGHEKWRLETASCLARDAARQAEKAASAWDEATKAGIGCSVFRHAAEAENAAMVAIDAASKKCLETAAKSHAEAARAAQRAEAELSKIPGRDFFRTLASIHADRHA